MLLEFVEQKLKRLVNHWRILLPIPLIELKRNLNLKKEKHHIVAKKAACAFNSRKLLQKANIEINSTYNLVYVKYRLHRCMHTKVYHDKVYRLLSKGKGERKKTIAILKYIKELLLAANKQIP